MSRAATAVAASAWGTEAVLRDALNFPAEKTRYCKRAPACSFYSRFVLCLHALARAHQMAQFSLILIAQFLMSISWSTHVTT